MLEYQSPNQFYENSYRSTQKMTILGFARTPLIHSWKNILLWTVIAITGIFAILWLIGFFKNLCCYGPLDYRTIQGAMPPFCILWDLFLYLLEKFEIRQRNRQDVQNNVMVTFSMQQEFILLEGRLC